MIMSSINWLLTVGTRQGCQILQSKLVWSGRALRKSQRPPTPSVGTLTYRSNLGHPDIPFS